jgi:hypothetical protein
VTAQQFLAALGLVLCLALLGHHALGARRQAVLRVWLQARMYHLRRWWQGLRQRGTVLGARRNAQRGSVRPFPTSRPAGTGQGVARTTRAPAGSGPTRRANGPGATAATGATSRGGAPASSSSNADAPAPGEWRDADAGAAAREAADVIDRARRRAAGASGAKGDGSAPRRDGGNVVRPPRFGDRRNDLH